MQIRHHKTFRKQHRKLPPNLKKKVKITIKLFSKNPHDGRLRNHTLKGTMNHERAIAVTGDVRIVFKTHGDYKKITLLRIGTHNQIY